jgi:hypothetical protein
LQQQLVGAGSSHVQQVRVGLHHGVNFGLVSSLVSGSAHLSAETAVLCCAVQARSGQTSHAARMPTCSSVCAACCCLAWGLLASFLH